MKLVVDSNVLFTLFWKNSVFNKISLRQDLELFAPEFAIEEINKYKKEIIQKTKISEKEFIEIKKELAIRVEFISIEEYSNFLNIALKIINTEKELLNDIDFIALALKLKVPLWTNDKLIKKIKEINVINTKELIEVIE